MQTIRIKELSEFGITDYDSYVENVSTCIKNIESYVNDIDSYWQGDDAASFKKTINGILKKLKKYDEVLIEYWDYLKKIPNVYGAIESSYNKNISVK